MSKTWRANLMLLGAAMIWGAAFVAQSVGMDYVEPFTFQAARCLLGGVVLLPVIALMQKKAPAPAKNGSNRDLWTAGLLCGLCLFAAATLQQFGLLYTSAGKSGFITALYVVLVPCAGLLLHKRAPWTVWVGAGIAAAALYFLCVKEDFSIGLGELLTLGCALCFTAHIMVVDHFSVRVDGIIISCIQLFVCGMLSLAATLLFERPSLPAIARCWLPIAYAGILSCGVAYTFQILGQRDTKPAVASLLMSMESVFAVIFGALLLRERLVLQEYFGCILMFIAIVLAQLPQHEFPLRSGIISAILGLSIGLLAFLILRQLFSPVFLQGGGIVDLLWKAQLATSVFFGVATGVASCLLMNRKKRRSEQG